MAKTVQIDAAAHGILNVSARVNALKSGVPLSSDWRAYSPTTSLQKREGKFRYKELHDHDKEMRTHTLQLYGSTRKDHCSDICADAKKTPELTCQCKHPKCSDIGLKM